MTRRILTITVAALSVATLSVATVVGLPAAPASAHPLGTFSVNQYLGFTLRPDRVDVRAAVDIAEIPTLADRARVDPDGNGATDAERAAHAQRSCQELAAAVDARVDRSRLEWTVTDSRFGYSPGAGGLEVSRLGCGLTAPAALAGQPALFSVDNHYLADRVGWRELAAVGEGVHLVDSELPAHSVSDELNRYPADLLSSTLDVRSATVRVEPGGIGGGATGDATAGDASAGTGVPLAGIGGDPVSRWLAALDRRVQALVGGPTLTPLVALLAVGLALLLGAGHAVLPGHGKTVLAAYLAGRRGRPRDAAAVAGTVTLTHTGGVLVLGLLLATGTALAGERILGWLSLVSGTVILLVGLGMAAAVLRRRRRPGRPAGHPHDHPHDHHHQHDHAHDHGLGHDRGHGRSSGWGLAGIGVAGGLVPSPSALVVLLAAIGLGRAGFGVVLVVAYGVGMAATLTGAGLALLALQRRLARSSRLTAQTAGLAARLSAATPAATAAVVVLAGAGLAARAVAGVY